MDNFNFNILTETGKAIISEKAHQSVEFLIIVFAIVAALILIIRFCRTWLQRGIVAVASIGLVIAAPYLATLLVPFFGRLLESGLTVSIYLIILLAPIFLLVRWFVKLF